MERDAAPADPEERPPTEDPTEDEVTDDEVAELRPVDRWRRNTASGAITAALALGFQQVFDPEKKNTIGVEQEAPTQPVEPDGVDLQFDPLSSRGSRVVVRRPEDGANTEEPAD